MKKAQQLKELEVLVSKMEHNHFLLPDSFSDVIEMTFEDFEYKTYVGTRGKGRYINFYIYKEGVEVLELTFRDKIITTNEDISKRSSVASILNYIELIYKEKHSFENHAEGIKPLKAKIREEHNRITAARKEVQSLKNQIKGIQELLND